MTIRSLSSVALSELKWLPRVSTPMNSTSYALINSVEVQQSPLGYKTASGKDFYAVELFAHNDVKKTLFKKGDASCPSTLNNNIIIVTLKREVSQLLVCNKSDITQNAVFFRRSF